jgi:hypothetical protein
MQADKFATHLIFSDEATLHLSRKVNCHTVRIWAIENVHHIIQQERDLTKVSVFCAIS